MNKTKNGLHLKTSQLQIRAMDLVQSIDMVNNTLQDWTDAKTSVREMIKQRSQELQDQVKSIERKLLATLDSKEDEMTVKDEAFAKKKHLHRVLRSSLSIVDFLRLLVEFGEMDEVNVYSDVIRQREQKLFARPIVLTQKRYNFEFLEGKTEDAVEKLFGAITVTPEEIEIWDPNKPAHKIHSDTNGMNNDIGQDEETFITSESNSSNRIQSKNITYNGTQEVSDQSSSSYITRRQMNMPQPRGNRRAPPSKSLSFDSSYSGSPLSYVANHQITNHMLYGNLHDHGNTHEQNTTEFEILNENETPLSQTKTKHTQYRDLDKDSFQSAIDSLISSSKAVQPFSQRSRRCSAPPSTIIDALNRRRLSALSILERANINTDGLTVTTDIESGMNEARQEWMRENMKRKIDRGDSIQEIV